MKANIYTSAGEKKGQVELNKKMFEVKVNEELIHQMLILQQANRRQAIAHTKTRSDVRGGGKKPFRQKGTGRARQGTIRAPHYVGGGIVFGPNSGQNFSKNMNKKQRNLALLSTLTLKAKSENVSVLEDYSHDIKTKTFSDFIKKMSPSRNILVIHEKENKNLQKSARNIGNVKTLLVNYLNVEDLLNYKDVLFLKSSLEKAESLFIKK